MSTEVWLRNPWNYIREVVEVGHCWMAWDRGLLRKRGDLDMNAFCDANVPTVYDYRSMAIGEQGAVEVDRTTSMHSPKAVYPVWDYTEHAMDDLLKLIALPVGEDPRWYKNAILPPDQRPVKGQEHRIVIIRPPDFRTGIDAKTFYPMIRDIQGEHPEVILHLHGSYSYRATFGMELRSADLDPSDGRGARIFLPMGKYVKRQDLKKYQQWVNVVGGRPSDLDTPRGVCMFNIRSALWAGQHFNEEIAFRVREVGARKSATLEHYNPGALVSSEDKFLCDRCSLAVSCKYFREGAVCSLPGSESVELSRFFTSRDSAIIITGLTRLLEFQAERLEDGRENEKLTGDLDPEVTRIADSLFERALKLAKLLDPQLDPKRPLVSMQVNSQGPTQINNSQFNMQEEVAKAFSALEAKGVPREAITSEMVESFMAGKPLALGTGS